MAKVVAFPVEPIHLELNTTDPDVVRELASLPEGQTRTEYALLALRIGVLALRQARGEMDRESLHHEADVLLANVQEALTAHRIEVTGRIEKTLEEYLDPNKGHLQERIERLVGHDGELETILQREVDGEDSHLAKTLASHIGDRSPIMRLLSPQESDGLIQTLSQTIEAALREQRQKILDQFSLDNKDSALSRLVIEISENNGKLTGDLGNKVGSVIGELSLDNENSAIARLRTELLDLQEKQRKQLADFQNDVNVALASIASRKAAAAASNLEGREFEDILVSLISQVAQETGDLVVATGAMVGLKQKCKTGDCVIELGPDRLASKSKIVVEAKDRSNYAMREARDEIAEARENRGAEVGVFVFSKATCPPELDDFARIGNDIFTFWDPDDPSTDIYVKAGLSVATALCTRSSVLASAEAADLEEIDKAVLEIEKQIGKLGDVETSAETIMSSAQKIIDRIRVSRASVERQIDKIKSTNVDAKTVMARLSSST